MTAILEHGAENRPIILGDRQDQETIYLVGSAREQGLQGSQSKGQNLRGWRAEHQHVASRDGWKQKPWRWDTQNDHMDVLAG